MLKKGDKVRIVGSTLFDDFTQATFIEDDCGLYKLDLGEDYVFLDEYFVFKEGSFGLFLMKLFKRKKYVKYQRTHKKCNEV